MKIPDNQFLHIVDYDYDSYHCNGCYGCESGDDYCRGAEYEGLRATIPQTLGDDLAAKISDIPKSHKTDSLIEIFAVERLISNMDELSESENYEVFASPDYYGEEVDSIRLSGEVYDSFKRRLEALGRQKDNLQKILFALTNEYGNLTPTLNGALGADVASINISDIVTPENNNLHEEALTQYVQQFSTYFNMASYGGSYKEALKIPRIVVEAPINGKYRLIDGRHRLAAYKKLNKRKIPAIVISVQELDLTIGEYEID